MLLPTMKSRIALPAALAASLATFAADRPAAVADDAAKVFGEIKEVKLENGLTLLLVPDRAAPVFTIMLWVPAGSRTERPGTTGLSHYLEHCYSMGSSKLGPREIDRLVLRLGGTKNAFTFVDYTAYYESLPRSALETIVEMEADRLATLALPAERLKSEIEVVKEERRLRYENSPDGLLGEKVLELAFTSHPYRWPVIGWMKDLEAVTREDAVAYYRTHYIPANVTYVVVGDIDLAETEALFRKHFGALPSGVRPAVEVAPEPPQEGERRATIRMESATLPRLSIAYHAVDVDHPDLDPLTVLETILAEGPSSRFARVLRRERKLVTGSSASAAGWRDPSPFFIEAEAQPGVAIEEVERAIYAVLAEVAAKGPTAEELDRAKKLIEVAFLTGLESTSAKARVIGRYHIVSRRGHRYLLDYTDRIRGVTAEDVRRVARTYLRPERRTVVFQLPPDVPDPDPSAGGPGAADLPGAPHGATARRVVLENGLTVLDVRTTKVPAVSLGIAFRAGAAQDPPGKAGLSTLAALALPTGTATRDEDSIAEAFAALGTGFRVDRGPDHVTAASTFLARDLEPGLALVADVLRNPTFAEDKVERVRRELLAEKESERADPEDLLVETFYRVVYAGHPYQWPINGTPTTLRSIARDDVVAFHRAHYRPENAVLAVAGEFDPHELVRAIAGVLGGAWHAGSGAGDGAGAASSTRTSTSTKGGKGVRVVFFDKPDQTQAYVRLGAPAVARAHEDYDRLVLANYVLGGAGLVSRIADTVRTKRGLAYSAGSSLIARREPGPWAAQVQTKSATAGEAVELILAELRRFLAEGPTAKELEDAKAQFAGSLPFRSETNAQKAALLLDGELHGLGPDHVRRQIARIQAMTAEELRSAATRHLPAEGGVLVIVGNRKEVPDEKLAGFASSIEPAPPLDGGTPP